MRKLTRMQEATLKRIADHPEEKVLSKDVRSLRERGLVSSSETVRGARRIRGSYCLTLDGYHAIDRKKYMSVFELPLFSQDDMEFLAGKSVALTEDILEPSYTPGVEAREYNNTFILSALKVAKFYNSVAAEVNRKLKDQFSTSDDRSIEFDRSNRKMLPSPMESAWTYQIRRWRDDVVFNMHPDVRYSAKEIFELGQAMVEGNDLNRTRLSTSYKYSLSDTEDEVRHFAITDDPETYMANNVADDRSGHDCIGAPSVNICR